MFQKPFPMLEAIDDNLGTARNVKKTLILNNLVHSNENANLQFFESGKNAASPQKYLDLLNAISL